MVGRALTTGAQPLRPLRPGRFSPDLFVLSEKARFPESLHLGLPYQRSHEPSCGICTGCDALQRASIRFRNHERAWKGAGGSDDLGALHDQIEASEGDLCAVGLRALASGSKRRVMAGGKQAACCRPGRADKRRSNPRRSRAGRGHPRPFSPPQPQRQPQPQGIGTEPVETTSSFQSSATEPSRLRCPAR